MPAARVRLILASVLFAAWIFYLGWLAWTTARPHIQLEQKFAITKTHYEVLSRSQFLVADMDIAAEVNDQGIITDYEVLWSADGQEDRQIALGMDLSNMLKDSDLEGVHHCLVPLVRSRGSVSVATLPTTPGFPRRWPSDQTPSTRAPVYHDNDQTRAQEREIRKR